MTILPLSTSTASEKLRTILPPTATAVASSAGEALLRLGAVVSAVVVVVVVVVVVALLSSNNTVSSTLTMVSEIVSNDVVGISSSALRSIVEIPSTISSST